MKGQLLTMPRAEYDALDRINNSTLQPYRKSPAHGLYASSHRRDSDPLKRGRAVSLALFEPAEFSRKVVVYEGKRDDRIAAWRDFQAEHADKEILKPDEHAEAMEIGHAVRSDKWAGPLLTNGRGELTALWEADGHPAKSRLDWLQNDGGWLVDVKTTRDASPNGFSRSVEDYGYLEQAAFYSDAAEQATGKRHPFAFIAVEVGSGPLVVQVYTVSEFQLDLGRERYRTLLAKWAECNKRNEWPGYSNGPMDLVLSDRAMEEAS